MTTTAKSGLTSDKAKIHLVNWSAKGMSLLVQRPCTMEGFLLVQRTLLTQVVCEEFECVGCPSALFNPCR